MNAVGAPVAGVGAAVLSAASGAEVGFGVGSTVGAYVAGTLGSTVLLNTSLHTTLASRYLLVPTQGSGKIGLAELPIGSEHDALLLHVPVRSGSEVTSTKPQEASPDPHSDESVRPHKAFSKNK